jgi:hypothetical protein
MRAAHRGADELVTLMIDVGSGESRESFAIED